KSPFGAAVTPDLSTPSQNRVETSVYQVAPTLRGQLSDIASYQLRLNETNVRVDDASLPDTRTTEWVGKISNASPSAKLGWAVDANALRLRNEAVGTLEDSRIRGSLIYAFDPQFHVSGIAGHESTDSGARSERAGGQAQARGNRDFGNFGIEQQFRLRAPIHTPERRCILRAARGHPHHYLVGHQERATRFRRQLWG